tara:strand:- start:120 stop:1004 length:885 start_codon:yes stop_codon:yes gene_type:complete
MPFNFGQTYFRNWRNADRFNPGVTPPRQKFQGFAEFHFNPNIAGVLNDSSILRTQLSTLVQTVKIPEITFQTAVKRQYNHRRIVQTGVDYGPCNITVIDTVANEWLTMFMKYFAFQYNDPRNRTSGASQATSRSSDATQWDSNKTSTITNSKYMSAGYKSNDAGMDIHEETHFIDSIRIINYHGGKGVEYILFRPQITSFTPESLDYTDSGIRTFDIDFEIESMTVNSTFNFEMDEQDLARFEQNNIKDNAFDLIGGWTEAGSDFVKGNARGTRHNDFLGHPVMPRDRAGQDLK